MHSPGISLRIISENGPEVISIIDLLQFYFPLQLDCFAAFEQFRYQIQNSNTIDLSTRLWWINPTNSVVIPQSLVLRSVVLGWIEYIETGLLCDRTLVNKISSLVSFHKYFQVFHMKFNICFWNLVLLKMISIEKIFKTVARKFAIQCK